LSLKAQQQTSKSLSPVTKFNLFNKKSPAIRPGNKVGTGLGMPIPMAHKKGESEPTPGYSVFGKTLQKCIIQKIKQEENA